MYKPSQRKVEIEMLASAGWVSGTLHVPERSALLAFFNKKSEFMPMHAGAPGEQEFLALRRQSLMLVIPDPADIDEHGCVQPGTFETCRIRCLFPGGSVEGTIQILSGQRMSDFLETNPGFFLLSECTLACDDGHAQSGVPHVLVNSQHLLAVSDLTLRDRGRICLLDLEPAHAR
jgi:hypothetical protein